MKPLLSIIIPTKNRYRTLTNLVNQLLKWPSSEFEIIVHDNSEDNTPILSFLEEVKNDIRLKYIHEGDEVLSVTENSTRALVNSTGEFACFLGDDDGIINQALHVVKWMKASGVDSLNCSHGSYCWPEYRFKNSGKKKSLAGMLLFRGCSGSIRKQDPLESLNNLLENGALQINDITRFYHGIVSRKILEELKNKSGTYFPGPVADMSSAVGLAFFSKNHHVLDFPLIIAGASGSSYAGKSGQKKNDIRIEKQLWLPRETVAEWSKCLPKYLTGQTIWPESAIQALKKTGNSNLIPKLNLPKVYAEYLVDFPELALDFKDFLRKNYSLEEQSGINEKIKAFKKKYKINKLKYWLKVYAVYFNGHKSLGLTKIDAEDIGTALNILEIQTDSNVLKKKSALNDIIMEYK